MEIILYTILVILLVGVADFGFYACVPHDFRMRYTWRLMAGSGFALAWLYRRSPQWKRED